MSENMPESKDLSSQPSNRILEFIIGFVSWYIVNGLIYFFLSDNPYSIMFCGLGIIPLNLLAMIILGIKRRFVGLGLLVAFAVNLLITTLMGVFSQGVCFAPFFIENSFF
jgi:hypothetical protein